MRLLVLLWWMVCAGLARAEEPETYRGVLDAGVGGTGQRQDGVGAISGNAALGVTVWPGRPLHDDGEPRSIQTFLQRPHDLGVTASGSYAFAVRDATATRAARRTDTSSATVNAFGGGWVGPVYLGAGLAGERLTQGTTSDDPTFVPSQYELLLLEPSVQVNVAVRPRYHLGARYRFRLRYLDGERLPSSWGTVEVWLRWVTAGHGAYWTARLFNLDGNGFGGQLYLEGFVNPRLGLYASATVESGLIYINSYGHYLRVALEVGAGVWLSRRVELVPSLTLYYTSPTEATTMSFATGSLTSLSPDTWSASLNLAFHWRY